MLEGNGLLTKEIESVLSRAQFDSQCSGKIELVYKFVLAGEEDPEGQTTVAFNLPNEYGSDVESVWPNLPSSASQTRQEILD